MLLPFLDAPFFVGLLLSWSLAAPPGPANALMAQDASRRGFWAGWWTGLGACAGDLVMFGLMWLGVVRLLGAAPWAKVALGAAGALLMAKFARDAWRAARGRVVPDVKGRGSFHRSFLIVVTSPFNWGWWLTVGAALFADLGAAVMVGFFAGLVAWVAFWNGLATLGAARVRRFAEMVGYASAGVLAVFAVVVAWFAVRTLVELLA